MYDPGPVRLRLSERPAAGQAAHRRGPALRHGAHAVGVGRSYIFSEMELVHLDDLGAKKSHLDQYSFDYCSR